ncbi:MAG: valine--pyruvate transaminase, partial [Planctomycetes bacterium]|nr:valine--pyruvate transaminase [Planctomycetota bacterium]
MNVSKFGRKIAVQSGIGQLMDDLGAALAGHRDMLMLGGGNPAHIPAMEQRFRRSMVAMLEDGGRFDRAVGNYDPPQGSHVFCEAVAGLLKEQFGWNISR